MDAVDRRELSPICRNPRCLLAKVEAGQVRMQCALSQGDIECISSLAAAAAANETAVRSVGVISWPTGAQRLCEVCHIMTPQ